MNRNTANPLPWQQFRTADPSGDSPFLDVGRAEVLLNVICLADRASDCELVELVGAVFGASNGNPAVLRILIEAFADWPQRDPDAMTGKIEQLWMSCEKRAPGFDFIATLRRICSEQSPALPESMIEAIFDDPTFDFTAYLAWHNS